MFYSKNVYRFRKKRYCFLGNFHTGMKELVLNEIKNSLNENGFCDLTSTEIGEKIAYSSTGVNLCIKSLVNDGVLHIEKNNGKDRCKRKRHIYLVYNQIGK